jgi:hypothetical protein
MKPITTADSVTSETHISFLLVMRPSVFISFVSFSLLESFERSLRKLNLDINKRNTKEITRGMNTRTVKVINGIFEALPMIMLGGSPTRVIHPPIFDAKIMIVVKAKGLNFAVSATKKITGINIIIVVTLSSIIENSAIRTAKSTDSSIILPFDHLSVLTATNWKKPVDLMIATITIMPIRRNIALKSTNSEMVSMRILSETFNATRSIPAVKAISTRLSLAKIIKIKAIIK